MRSGELARLAGVTVRALRHYHQEGVLPEPERGSNGYREYRVSDLVRVLRIRRLAAVGIPLDEMPALLAHLAGDEGMPRLERLYEILSAPALAPLVAEISARFAEIDADTASAEIDGFIETVVVAFGPVVAEMTDAGGAVDLGPGARLVDDLVRIQFTPEQRRVLREIERRLS